jgi:hypothetical protein
MTQAPAQGVEQGGGGIGRGVLGAPRNEAVWPHE